MARATDNPDYTVKNDVIVTLEKLLALEVYSADSFGEVLKKNRRDNGQLFAKDELITAYRQMVQKNKVIFNQAVIEALKLKPIRTLSGVAPVTVLTKPFPCPGECIFCPNDIRMPKSYLSDEPGAQRAERNFFDPYLQTYNRLQALHNIGHSLDKVELIVLGGTWSLYPEPYQVWFIKECFRALNDFLVRDSRNEIIERYEQQFTKLQQENYLALTNDPKANKQSSRRYEIDGATFSQTYNRVVSKLYVGPEKKLGLDQLQTASWSELYAQHQKNESAHCRCVGLVVETRPDAISSTEVLRLRKLGCTKTQIGVQSLSDSVLKKNKRGHKVAATRRAFRLLRQAGFKIHAHWMANLYGSSVAKDKRDFLKLFSDSDIRPDELKIYPCSLIGSAELMQYYQDGRWQPYTKAELLEVVSFALTHTPAYCRLTRVVRDIPSTDIVAGNKLTNFRQIAQLDALAHGGKLQDIRAREIRSLLFDPKDVKLKIIKYKTGVSWEYFLQLVVPEKNGVTELENKSDQNIDRIVGFLRLSLPTTDSYIDELKNAAMIRELHVYGQLAELDLNKINKINKKSVQNQSSEKAQHTGFGTRLLAAAQKIAAQKYDRLAVISAVGTRGYYRKKGFTDGKLYQFLPLA